MSVFAELGLAEALLKSLESLGFSNPTPIQQEAIPQLLNGVDLLAAAQTGTGKTAAFSLPILHRLMPFATTSPSPAKHPVRFLVLTPTRELAMQVFDSIVDFTKFTPFRTVCAYGGVAIQAQKDLLQKGADILVATPGRLLDHLEQGLHLSAVQALVLDEADRMLDMGFLPDVLRILKALPPNRQSLLFSATVSKEIKALAQKLLNQPHIIEIAPQNKINKNIAHVLYPVESRHKKAFLLHLLNTEIFGQALVFVKTKQGASRLNRDLQAMGILAETIHGDRAQNERIKVFDAFKSGEVRVLVATDVAARGLDVDDLPFVINFELPTTAEDYVHRIGRTGRAGKSGMAISFLSEEEAPFLAEIEALIQQKIARKTLPAFSKTQRRATVNTKQPMPNVAFDGFRFDLPYTPKNNTTAPKTSSVKKNNTATAVLLGGKGR